MKGLKRTSPETQHPLGEEGKRLTEQVERLEKQRSELEQQLKELGDDHADEYTYRRQLEERLATGLLGEENLRGELESAADAAAALREQVERLEQDLRAARGAASIERAARERLEQLMADLCESEEDADFAAEQEVTPWPFPRPEPAAGEYAAVEPLQAEDDGEEPPPGWVQEEELEEEESAPQGPRAWFKRRRAPAPCAVCQLPPPALGDAELAESGWTLNDEGALCAACREDGWQFPAGSAAPFRRMGAPTS